MYKLLDTCIYVKYKDETIFIKYDNIFKIQFPKLSEEKWIISVFYTAITQEKIGYGFSSNTKEEAEKEYDLLVNRVIKYHTKNNSLEEKVDKLLSHVEILPGGEEYEKSKHSFES